MMGHILNFLARDKEAQMNWMITAVVAVAVAILGGVYQTVKINWLENDLAKANAAIELKKTELASAEAAIQKQNEALELTKVYVEKATAKFHEQQQIEAELRQSLEEKTNALEDVKNSPCGNKRHPKSISRGLQQ